MRLSSASLFAAVVLLLDPHFVVAQPQHAYRFRANDSIALRELADGKAPLIRTLPRGTAVLITDPPVIEHDFVRATLENGTSGWIVADQVSLDLSVPDFASDLAKTRDISSAIKLPRLIGFDTVLVKAPGGTQAMHTVLEPVFEIESIRLPKASPNCPTAVPPMKNFRDGENWMLVDDMGCELRSPKVTVIVPRGFVTDFASIPPGLRLLAGPTGPYGMAAVVHDFLYWDHTCSKDDADRIFRIGMEEADVSTVFKSALFLAVSLFGTQAYLANASDKAAGFIRVVAPPDDDVPVRVSWSRFREQLRSAHKPERQYVRPSHQACSSR